MLSTALEPSLFYFISLVFIIFLLFFCLVLIISFLFFRGTIRDINKTDLVIKEEAHKKALQMLEDARKQSMKILEDSLSKAQEIINETKALSDETKRSINTHFDDITQGQQVELSDLSATLLNEYKDEIRDQKKKNIETLQTISHEVETEVKNEISEFKDVLHKETINAESQIQNKIKQDYSAIENELKQYKHDKLSSLDEKIYEIITLVSKRIIGKALSLEEHEDFIMKVLEDIKKEGVFENS